MEPATSRYITNRVEAVMCLVSWPLFVAFWFVLLTVGPIAGLVVLLVMIGDRVLLLALVQRTMKDPPGWRRTPIFHASVLAQAWLVLRGKPVPEYRPPVTSPPPAWVQRGDRTYCLRHGVTDCDLCSVPPPQEPGQSHT